MRIACIHFCILLLMIYAVIAVIVSTIGLANIYLPEIDLISIASLFMFLSICAIGFTSEKMYLGSLIFILLAFPTAVNNFLPGIYLGPHTENGASIFPLFSHIDLYLIAGIVRFSQNKFDKPYVHIAPLVLILVFLMWLSLVINTLDSRTIMEAQLLAFGSFQFRYIILIYLVLSLLKQKSLRAIAWGLTVSVAFLLLESVVFTFVSGSDRLASGSLATNTYGNIMAQTALFLWYYSTSIAPGSVFRLSLRMGALVGLTIAFLTQTRMSLLSALGSISIIWLNRRMTATHVVRVAFAVVILLIAIVAFDLQSRLPQKFKVWEIISWQTVTTIMQEDRASQTAVEYTPESSSLTTRIQLYRTSLRMIWDDPLWGTGPGRWNYLKRQYGYDIPVLLDSHNGYLALLSQYGIPTGIALIVFLLIAPALIVVERSKAVRQASPNDLWQLGVIPMGMAIAELSNAGVFKPQVFALLTLISLILIAERRARLLNETSVQPNGNQA